MIPSMKMEMSLINDTINSTIDGSNTTMVATALRDSIISAISSVMGVDPSFINNFQFKVGTTPLSHISYPFTAVIGFCIFVPLLAHFMRNRHSPPMRYVLLVHNMFLSFSSGALALFLMATVWSFRESDGDKYDALRLYCGLDYMDQRGALTFIYYLNHLLKYYELLDTVFLALKHKPLTFLHCYHHPATLVLTWGQLVDSTGFQWVVILLNLYVHTVMYFYYAMATMRVRMPWKRIVTIGQIVQFVLDLMGCYIGYFIGYTQGKCYGTTRGAVVGTFILTSYLYLFIDFYEDTYSQKKKLKRKKL